MPKLDHIHTAPQKILILGANGQLGQAFARMFEASTSSAQQDFVEDYVQASVGHIQRCSDLASAQDQGGPTATGSDKYKQLEQVCIQTQNRYKRTSESVLTLPGPSQGGPDLSTEHGLQALERYLLEHRPSIVINAAAYTAVDHAEQEPEKAFQLNAILPERLLKILAQWQGRLIHFSTDYVFNPNYETLAIQADKTIPYVGNGQLEPLTHNGLVKCGEDAFAESIIDPMSTYGLSKCGEEAVAESINTHGLSERSEDTVAKSMNTYGLRKCAEDAITEPINTYGLSKLAGEQAVLRSGLPVLLIRTSWLYSVSGHNFFNTMHRLMQQQTHISVVDDQWGVPTSVDFLVRYTWQLQQQGAQGLFHVVPDGVCTWFEFAQAIAQELSIAGETLRLKEILGQSYHQYQESMVAKNQGQGAAAARPAYAVLDNTKLKHTLNAALPTWRESLHAFIHA
ncbi:MAG: sugar nucleotide-binding protein [Pelistega sp.]|nr:sugar nucleotide-binding protein [Pelistega sp.]